MKCLEKGRAASTVKAVVQVSVSLTMFIVFQPLFACSFCNIHLVFSIIKIIMMFKHLQHSRNFCESFISVLTIPLYFSLTNIIIALPDFRRTINNSSFPLPSNWDKHQSQTGDENISYKTGLEDIAKMWDLNCFSNISFQPWIKDLDSSSHWFREITSGLLPQAKRRSQ